MSAAPPVPGTGPSAGPLGPAPRICVVVPTYNRRDRLAALLSALEGQTLPRREFDVVFVDDRSSDGTFETLQELARSSILQPRILQNPRNTGGPAAGRNLGWLSTGAPVVAFLDDDCLPAPTWLAEGLAAMEQDPGAGVGQGRTDIPPGVDLEQLDRWCVWRSVTALSPWFEGTNIFYRRAALEEVGGFDDQWPIWGEDTDLGWRVVKAGWRAVYMDRAAVVHEVADRGWREAARFGWKDRQVIEVAGIHPEVRTQGFWRPWALHRQGAEFAAALVGLGLALRWRPAAAMALPYMYFRRPPFRRPGTVRIGLQTVVVDFVRLAGHLRGSVAARILVL